MAMANRTVASVLAPLVCVVGLIGGGCTAQEQMSKSPKFTGMRRDLPPVPPAKPEPLDPELRALARKQITSAVRARDPLVRAHAMESIRQVGGTDGGAEVLWGLSDQVPVVRFAASMAAGEMRLAEAHDQLLKMVNDPDKAVQVGVRFALHKLGDKSRSHDLEKTARDIDTAVRADTAMVLGMLNEQSAMKILKEMQFDRSAPVRLQVFEAMWRLGDQEGREQLVAATFSHYADDQAVAYLALAAPRDAEMLVHVRQGLTSEYSQINLIAARAAGMLGSDLGYPIALEGARSEDPVQRVLAGFALGAIGRSDSQVVLGKLLGDSDPDVRLAAATAVLQLREGR